MKLFLVRHAEGENAKTNWQFPNSPLSSHGVRQATALASIKRFNKIDKVFSSGLLRAKQTAELVVKDLGKSVEERPDIYERVQSSRIYGLSRSDAASEQYLRDLSENTHDWNYKWDAEEEAKNEVRARAIGFKNYLETAHSEESVLVVSHENFLKHLITVCVLGSDEVTKETDKLYRSINTENTGVSLLIFNSNSKSWKTWYLNDYAHLGKVVPE